MSTRELVLQRIRAALSDVPADEKALVAGTPSYRRSLGLDATARLALFADRVADYRAAVHVVSEGQVPELVASLVAVPLVVAPGVPAAWVPEGLDLRYDDPPLSVDQLDAAGAVLTGAVLGIAETGTFVLDGRPLSGRRLLTLLPDHHVCVLRADQLVDSVPEAVGLLDPCRPMTWVSGPSATSDIELERVEGVHGPRRLDVVVLS